MTTKEAIEIQKTLLKKIQTSEFMYPLVADAHAFNVERVFDQGLASDGAPIGTYSEKKTDYYADPGSAIVPKGKTGETVFKKGKKAGQRHKLKWFENYKAYRAFKHKETRFVNLRFTEIFKLEYASHLRFENGTVIVYLDTKRSQGILTGAIDRYGKRAFKLSESDLNKMNQNFSKKINRILIEEGLKHK